MKKFRLVHSLLIVPFVVLCWVGLYDRDAPVLAGIPFFYWFQMLCIPAGVLLLWPVYSATKRSEDGK